MPIEDASSGSTNHVASENESAKLTSRFGGAGTVLVVEDEEHVRGLFVRVLKKAGYEVLEAKHGLEALLVSQAHTGEIDLVVSDVIMPCMYGPEAVKQLVSARPDLKVLYISAYNYDLTLHEELAGRRVNYLQKPVSPSALVAVVRNILDD